MVDRQTLVAANWKMNGTLGGIPNLLDALIKGVSTETQSEVVICPPFVYLAELAKELTLPLDAFPLETADTPSYPSGHASSGRLTSLLVADEAPLELSLIHI